MKYQKGVVLLFLAAILLLGGCGVKVNQKSPENVVKSMISAYQFQDEKALKKCFGVDKKKEMDSDLKEEVDYNLKFFEAHDAKDVTFKKCESLGAFNGYEFVYVIYDFDIKRETTVTGKDGKKEKKTVKLEAPSIGTYFVKKKDNEYFVVSSKDITTEMSDISKEQYAKFMKKEDYKSYEKSYEAFIKKYPDYEKDLTASLEKLMEKKDSDKES